MTRCERIKKLANAVKAYRGSYNPRTGKWISPPQLHRRDDVVKWLKSLRTEEQIWDDLKQIVAFKAISEFDKWIATIN
jgi:hypothetical protein